ncbi:hypothetical protein BAE44_0024176, partial [Dichanthelium oligosanthes]
LLRGRKKKRIFPKSPGLHSD